MKLDKQLKNERNVSRRMRLHYLQGLEEMVNNFFIPYSQDVNEPYSMQELNILVRIIKKLIRQLFGTPKYRLFKRKQEKYIEITPEMAREIHFQKTDAIRMGQVHMADYDPFSEKCKTLKKSRAKSPEK